MKSIRISEKEYQAKVAAYQPKEFRSQRVHSSIGAFIREDRVRIIDPILNIKG